MAGRFGKADISWNHGSKDLLSKVILQLRRHVSGQTIAHIDHRSKDTGNF